jgi:hypothetical protein
MISGRKNRNTLDVQVLWFTALSTLSIGLHAHSPVDRLALHRDGPRGRDGGMAALRTAAPGKAATLEPDLRLPEVRCAARALRSPDSARTARAASWQRRSEEAERVLRVADQQVLGLLVVVQHHLVVLPADAGLLVAAERRVRG